MPSIDARRSLQLAQVAWRLLLLALLAARVARAQSQAVTTVTELKNEIYTTMGPGQSGDACVLLLTATGVVGCSTRTGQQPVEGRLLRLDALRPPDDYPDGTVFLLPPVLLADFLLQCQANPSLAARVRGVLSEPLPAPTYSQAAAAPLDEFALYSERGYRWNAQGKGLNDLALPFPVFLLDNSTADNARQRAAYNEEQNMSGALNHARMRLTMEASGSSNSSACLAARTCLPLGGHSVVATLPALPPLSNSSGSSGGSSSGSNTTLPAIWILAQYDSSALFHEQAVGAEGSVSGLIAMLAAAEVLGGAGASSAAGRYHERYRRRLVFAALGGEPWGLMGSKRLLWEAAAGGSSAVGLGLAPGGTAAVLEVSQVGRAQRDSQVSGTAEGQQQQPEGGGVQLYAHTAGAGGASASAGLLAALQAAAGNTSAEAGQEVAVQAASSTLPGLPPTASAGSFLRVLGSSSSSSDADGGGDSSTQQQQLPAVLLSDFDGAFQGPSFQSHYDTIGSVDADSITAAAVVLARAAHALALGGSSEGGGGGAAELPLAVNYTAVKGTVQELMQCLLNTTVGLSCPIAQAMMTPVGGGHVGHYIGILRTITADPQTPDANIKSDYERFLWNWLAFATRPKPAANSSSGSGAGSEEELSRCQPLNATACPPGFVCAGSRSIKGPEGQGYCLNTTVRFVPSYSTSLVCDGCDGANTNYEFRWKTSDAAAQWEQQHSWPPDPLWTESNWPNDTPSLTLFLKEDPTVEAVLLGAGLAVAAASVAGAMFVRFAYHRKLKRQ